MALIKKTKAQLGSLSRFLSSMLVSAISMMRDGIERIYVKRLAFSCRRSSRIIPMKDDYSAYSDSPADDGMIEEIRKKADRIELDVSVFSHPDSDLNRYLGFCRANGIPYKRIVRSEKEPGDAPDMPSVCHIVTTVSDRSFKVNQSFYNKNGQCIGVSKFDMKPQGLEKPHTSEPIEAVKPAPEIIEDAPPAVDIPIIEKTTEILNIISEETDQDTQPPHRGRSRFLEFMDEIDD